MIVVKINVFKETKNLLQFLYIKKEN